MCSRRLLLLLCLVSLLPLLHSESIIQVPESEMLWMRSELVTLKQNLQLRDSEIVRLQAVSVGSQQQIANILTDSKLLQTQIDKLLTDSEISEAEYQKIVNDYKDLLTQSTAELQAVKKKLKRNRIALGVTVLFVIIESFVIKLMAN